MQKNQEWKSRVQELFQTAQDEFKRTTEIGKKMLTASKTNSSLHEAYEALGMLAVKEIERGNLEWNNPKVKELLEQISHCQKDLEDIESEVKKIKFASGPTDVSMAGTPVRTPSKETVKEDKVVEDKAEVEKTEKKKDDDKKES